MRKLIILCSICCVLSVGYFMIKSPLATPIKETGKHPESGGNRDSTVVSIIGDSWAERSNSNHLDQKIDSILRKNGISSITKSKGTGGAKSKEIYQRLFDAESEAGLKNMITCRPEYVVLFCGVNDSHGQYGEHFYAYHTVLILKYLIENGIHPVYLELPDYRITRKYAQYSELRVLFYHLRAIVNSHSFEVDNIARYRASLLKEIDKENIRHDVIYIPYANLKKESDTTRLYSDDMHLSEYGYSRLAEVIADAIVNFERTR